jgi:anti-anti-sigma regulatory factor
MFNLEYEAGSGGSEATVLKVSGEMTMAHADELKTAFLKAIDTYASVQVDLEKATNIDLTAMQILCAAHRYATKKDRIFAFAFPPRGNIRDTVTAAGYSRHVGCSHDAQNSCIWRSCRNESL